MFPWCFVCSLFSNFFITKFIYTKCALLAFFSIEIIIPGTCKCFPVGTNSSALAKTMLSQLVSLQHCNYKTRTICHWWGKGFPSLNKRPRFKIFTLFFSDNSDCSDFISVLTTAEAWWLFLSNCSSRSCIWARNFLFSLSRVNLSVSILSRFPHSSAFSFCSLSSCNEARTSLYHKNPKIWTLQNCCNFCKIQCGLTKQLCIQKI